MDTTTTAEGPVQHLAPEAFAERAAAMGRYVKSAPPIDPAHPVLLPGEREQRIAGSAGEGPVLVDGPTWAAMTAKAGERIKLPQPLPE